MGNIIGFMVAEDTNGGRYHNQEPINFWVYEAKVFETDTRCAGISQPLTPSSRTRNNILRSYSGTNGGDLIAMLDQKDQHDATIIIP